jgi:hypothetical protein
MRCRTKSRYGGAIERHDPGDAYLYQYDEECAEVETYRQKQVLPPLSPHLDGVDQLI